VEEEKRGGRDDEESRGGRTRVEERGVSGEGRSEGRRGGGRGGALSLREEETESQLDRRDEERRENSALNCHRSLETERQVGQLPSGWSTNRLVNEQVGQLPSGWSTSIRLVN